MSEHPGLRQRWLPVWDAAVRVLHWSLVLTVATAWLTRHSPGRWHEWIGYATLAIVAARVAWGFLGSGHARFSDFVRSAGTTASYAREVAAGREARYLGHNPLGGAWIVAMLALVLGAGGTGWALSVLGEEEHHWLEELHEGLSGGLLAAAAIHVAGVAWESVRHHENLVRAMVTGRKRPPDPGDR